MKNSRILFCVLTLAAAMIVLPVGSVNAMAASSDTAVAAKEDASNSNQLSVKQLTDGMESGEVQTIIWRENTEREHLDSEAYSIWLNNTCDGSKYKVSEDVYQFIKNEALKNDVKLVVLPHDGDIISANDFADIYAFLKINGAKAEKNGFTGYRCVMDTTVGEMHVDINDLDELQNFTSTYKLSIGEVINTTENKLCNIAFVMVFVFLAVFSGLLIKSSIWGCSAIEDITLTVSMIGFIICFEVFLVYSFWNKQFFI